jgi:hypothetical protein
VQLVASSLAKSRPRGSPVDSFGVGIKESKVLVSSANRTDMNDRIPERTSSTEIR